MTDADLAQHPSPVTAAAQVRRWQDLFVVGVCVYPAAFVASLYLTWFAAWAALGHVPRPSLNDPKFIGLLVDIPYWVTMGLLMGSPAAMALGAFLAPIAAGRRAAPGWRRVLLGLVALFALVLLWGATLLFMRADPWDVGYWYMD